MTHEKSSLGEVWKPWIWNVCRAELFVPSLFYHQDETISRFAAKQLPPEFKEAKVVPIPEATFTDINAITRKTM